MMDYGLPRPHLTVKAKPEDKGCLQPMHKRIGFHLDWNSVVFSISFLNPFFPGTIRPNRSFRAL